MAQMIAYTIYCGVKAGWLENTYLKYADKMRQAAYSKVDKFGIVQGAVGAPNFFKVGTSTEAQAFFLLMEAAYKDLKK
jgi:hypothetical protein